MTRVFPDHPSYCSIDYESYDLVDVPGSTMPLYKINNVVFNAKEIFYSRNSSVPQKELYVDEDVFIFDIFGYQYYHMLYDKMAQYEFIKKISPNIKVAFMTSLNMTFDSIRGHISSQVIANIIDIYELSETDIIYLTGFSAVRFRAVWHITQYSNGMVSKLPGHTLDDTKNDLEINKENSYIVQSAKALQELLDVQRSIIDYMPKKIYLSRSAANKDLQAAKELLSQYDSGHKMTKEDMKLLNHYAGSYGMSIDKLRDNIQSRLLDQENTMQIEKFFEEHGYFIIHAHEMSLFDQILYFYNATHVASFNGTGLSNTIFCKPGTNVLILNQNTSYRHHYADIALAATDNVYQFPDQNGYDSEKIFTSKEIISEINLKYLNLI